RLVALRGVDDVGGLGALQPFARLELDIRARGERLEALTADLRIVDAQILAAVLGLDELVALRVVEPLHGSGCHRKNTSPPVSRTVGEVRAARPVLALVSATVAQLASRRPC